MKSMLNISLLFLLTYFSGCASQAENISQYFPLNDGDVYTYHGKYKNKNYNNSYLVRSFTLSNRQKLYYFQKGIIEILTIVTSKK